MIIIIMSTDPFEIYIFFLLSLFDSIERLVSFLFWFQNNGVVRARYAYNTLKMKMKMKIKFIKQITSRRTKQQRCTTITNADHPASILSMS